MKKWTLEEIRELSDSGITNLRNNALAKGNDDIAARCNEVFLERQVKSKRPRRFIVELHYYCPEKLNLEDLGNGTYRTGNWVLAEEHCDPVVQNGAIIALHDSKSKKSFFQGKVIDWETAPPEKSPDEVELHRAIFLVEPTQEALDWFGDATGERGYKWSDD